jgi:hypothetical protein
MTQPTLGIYNALDAALAGLGDTCWQTLVARIELYSESIVMTRYDRQGKPAAAFELDPRDLAAAFAGQTVTTGLLPQGCLWVGRMGGEEALGLYLPPARHTLRFATGALYDVPLPGLVLLGNGARYHAWAVKAYPRAESERLFHAPLPNVSAEGRVCPGNILFPTASAATLRQAAQLFLESEFNADLSNGKVRSHKGSVLPFLRELSGADVFPLDELLPTPWVLGDAMRDEKETRQ